MKNFRPLRQLLPLAALVLAGCQAMLPTQSPDSDSAGVTSAETAPESSNRSKTAEKASVSADPIADPTTPVAPLQADPGQTDVLADAMTPRQPPVRQTTRALLPLDAYQPVTLAPVPDYAVDHITTDLARRFPDIYNPEIAYEWPKQVAKYERDIWHELRTRFTMDLSVSDPRVEAELSWYSRNQGYFNRVAQRAQRYLPFVLEQLIEHDMPAELALIPVIESAYDPFAYSHGRASGMWQFIPGTGRQYGLLQDWWYDGRRDVYAATNAAIRYYQDLGDMFDHDWELAMASYNGGPGTVLRAQRRARANGQPTDFWHLDLPRETLAYVPKIIALARIISDPEQYGLELPHVPFEPYFEKVDIEGQMDLAQAARLADMPLEDLYLLNPGYNQWATHPEAVQYLLVPREKASSFRQKIASLGPEDRMAWNRYRIEPGDSLLSIAGEFQTTVEVLRDVNDIAGNMIRAGDHLLIPTASASDTAYSMSAGNRLERTRNNNPGGRQRVDYTVRPGDSFWEISRRYDVGLRQLAAWNGKAPGDPIFAGDSLVIWTEPGQTAQSSGGIRPDDRSVMRRVGYTVRNGDSLHRIANRFNVSVADIQRWNRDNLGGDYIHPGLYLQLYVDVTNGPVN